MAELISEQQAEDPGYNADTPVFFQKEPPVPEDLTTLQLSQQNADLAQAVFDVVQILAATPGVDPALLQDAKTYINAVNPGKFVFPNP